MGLKGFPKAIEAVNPRTEVQLCIVHLVRASLNYVPWKARKPVAADLQSIYRAGTVTEAEQLVPCVADGRVLTALGFWRILVEAADEV